MLVTSIICWSGLLVNLGLIITSIALALSTSIIVHKAYLVGILVTFGVVTLSTNMLVLNACKFFCNVTLWSIVSLVVNLMILGFVALLTKNVVKYYRLEKAIEKNEKAKTVSALPQSEIEKRTACPVVDKPTPSSPEMNECLSFGGVYVNNKCDNPRLYGLVEGENYPARCKLSCGDNYTYNGKALCSS